MQRGASPPTKPSGARRVGKAAQVQVAAGKARQAGGEAAMLPGGPLEGACTAVRTGGGRGNAARVDACRTQVKGEDPTEATTVAIATAPTAQARRPPPVNAPPPPRVPVRTRQSEVALRCGAGRRKRLLSAASLSLSRRSGIGGKRLCAPPQRALIGPPPFTLLRGRDPFFHLARVLPQLSLVTVPKLRVGWVEINPGGSVFFLRDVKAAPGCGVCVCVGC